MSSANSHIYAYDETNSKFVRINAKGNDLTTHDEAAVAQLEQIATNTSTASPSEAISAQTNIDDVNTKIKLLSNGSGHLAVDIKNADVPVSGNFYPETQAVSGSVSVNTISGYATETTLDELNTKISTGSDNVPNGTHIQQVLVYGKDSGGIKHPIDVDSNGHLKTTQQDREIQRTNSLITTDKDGTALSGILGSQVATAYVDVQNYDKLSMIMSSSDGFGNTLQIQGSSTTNDADFVALDDLYEIMVGSSFTYKFQTESAFFRYYRFYNPSLENSISFGKIHTNTVK